MTELPPDYIRFCRDRQEACDRRIDDVRRLMLLQISNHEKIVDLYQKAIDRRVEGMNHLEEYLPTLRFESEHKILETKMDILTEWKARSEGEHSRTVLISWLAISISVVATFLHVIQTILGR